MTKEDDRGWRRVIIEKPFGNSLKSARELNRSIRSTLKEALARIGGDDHERMVTLRADGQTPHQAVVTAMDALGQLGFTHLSIATTPNKDSKGK